jgi:diguanylate cyclase (GGDEF)-like protein
VNIKVGMSKTKSRVTNARNDVMTGGIIVAAIIMLLGTGSEVMSGVIGTLLGVGGGVDKTLSVALLLNIALIMFGWRRYKDLSNEIVERTEAEQRAQVLASRDPLTGFLNRRALSEDGAALLSRTIKRQKTLAVLMLDLDHFKNVNDVHGHAIGDALLKTVATEVMALIPPSAISARLGGDEFACAFAYDAGNPEIVERIAQAIVGRLGQPFDAAGTFVHISASVGIAHTAVDCGSMDALMRRADIAMYAAKHQGRNRFAWFDVSMERELQARNETEQGLRIGIPKGEFVPYFEQQIDLTTNRLHGFEMLARWDHPTRGLVMPDNFIGIAEEIGAISDLSFSVMRQAFVEARNWDPSVSLSVNISPTQLKDPWLAQKLVKLLTETGFPATRLEIEITETSLFDNLALAQSIVGSLKNQGIRIALDDFGTGYSSLAHLRALPFDRIKIDKSFVTTICENSESAAIVAAITRLGESLGLPVTAEGIETTEIEERLRQLGCHKGQGWLYGRPLPLPAVRTLLAERNLLSYARAPEPKPMVAQAGPDLSEVEGNDLQQRRIA